MVCRTQNDLRWLINVHRCTLSTVVKFDRHYIVMLKNSGSVDGSTLDIAFSYVESDSDPNLVDKNADDTAAMLEVTALSCEGSSLLNSVDDTNGNGYKDICDLT